MHAMKGYGMSRTVASLP